MLVLFINAHRSLLLHMNDVCKSSVAKSDWCPIFDWWILLPKPGAMTEEVCTSEPWIAQKFEPVNSNNSSVQMFSDVFSTLFLGYKNHQKPSKTIKNHQKPSRTIKNHQKPSKTIKNHQKRTKTIKNHQNPRFSGRRPWVFSRWSAFNKAPRCRSRPVLAAPRRSVICHTWVISRPTNQDFTSEHENFKPA